MCAGNKIYCWMKRLNTEENTAMVESGQHAAINLSREFLTSLGSNINDQKLTSATSDKLRSLIAEAFGIGTRKRR